MARLLWLQLNEPQDIDQQKATLRALVVIAGSGAVRLEVVEGGVSANGEPVAAVFPGVTDLATRLAAHGARELTVDAAAKPGDLLGVVRILAADPQPGGSPGDRLRQLGITTVQLDSGPLGPPAAPAVAGFELVSEDVVTKAVAAPRARPSMELPAGDGQSPGGLFDQFAAARHRDDRATLIAELASAPAADALAVLDRVARAAEQAQRDDDGPELVALLAAVIRRENVTPREVRREFALMIRRVVSGHGLRAIAAMLPRRTAPREDIELVLARMGEEGAEAVIDQLTRAEDAGDRRAYFDLLITLGAGIPALTYMLGDSRWYVVRNAVDLLGEMGATAAEKPISALLQHPDERVRTSATTALLRFDTPTSRATVRGALHSGTPAVRQQAIVAMGIRKGPDTAVTLLQSLDREADPAVQQAIYAALGKVGTADAVLRLITAAEPAKGLFRRKPPELRAAAAAALGEARTPEALAALEALSDDRDREVREAAQRALRGSAGKGGKREW